MTCYRNGCLERPTYRIDWVRYPAETKGQQDPVCGGHASIARPWGILRRL